MELTRSVWERKQSRYVPYLSKQAYVAAVSGFTTYGMAAAAITAYLCLGWQLTSVWTYLLVGLVIPIIGICWAFGTENWWWSFCGYNMVVIGMGAICGPFVALHEANVVMNALLATVGVTIALSVYGVLFKGSLENWGVYLYGALWVAVLVSIARIFFPVSWVAPAADAKSTVVLMYYVWYVFDYLVALLFCIYIVFDWNRALSLPRTLDNAVDSSVAIFLDVINLFIRIVAIMGRKK